MSTEKTPAIQALEKQRESLRVSNEVHQEKLDTHTYQVNRLTQLISENNAAINDISKAIDALEYPNEQD